MADSGLTPWVAGSTETAVDLFGRSAVEDERPHSDMNLPFTQFERLLPTRGHRCAWGRLSGNQ